MRERQGGPASKSCRAERSLTDEGTKKAATVARSSNEVEEKNPNAPSSPAANQLYANGLPRYSH